MFFLRPATAFSSLTRRAAFTSVRQPVTIRALSGTPVRFAQGYGDGEGDPKAENPQDQGSSNDVKQHAEHPGPAPPSTGKGSGAGPTKGGSKPEDASAQSGGSRSKEAKETGSSPTGGKVKGKGEAQGKSDGKDKGKKGASPKISDKSDPTATSDKEKAEVEKHNREFEKGHDRAPPAAEDKVDKKFWEGQGGADKQS